MVENYLLFDQEFATNYFPTIRRLSDYTWKLLEIGVQEEELDKVLDNLVDIGPHSDKYGGIFSTLALNTLICLDVSYKCIKEQDNKAYMAGLYVYDAIFHIILSRSEEVDVITPDITQKIDDSDLIKNEVEHQRIF